VVIVKVYRSTKLDWEGIRMDAFAIGKLMVETVSTATAVRKGKASLY